MALSQFGGRGGSSSSSGAGKEVGELVLVPSSFSSADFAEAGQTVTAASLPTLYSSLAATSTGVASLAPHPTIISSASIVSGARSIGSFIRGSDTYIVIGGGRIVKSSDGLNWTEAAPLPLVSSFEKFAFVDAATVAVRQYRNIIAGTVGNTSVVIAMSYGKAIGYKTTDGVTWTKFSDAVLDNAAFISSGAVKGYINNPTQLGFNIWFSPTKAIVVVPGAKKVLASDDGLVWRDVTGTIPTTSFVQATSIPVHADSQSLTVFIAPIMYTSVDNGLTWKSATITYINGTAPTAFTNIVRFLGNCYIGAFNASSVVGFYRTTDLGTTWAGSGGSSVSGTTVSTYNTAMYTDGTTLRVNSFGANRTYSTTDGATWAVSSLQTTAPISNVTGLWYFTAQNRFGCTDSTGSATMLSTDNITTAVGPTLVSGTSLQVKAVNPAVVEFAKKGDMFVGLFANTVTTAEIVVGDAISVRTVTLPVADRWVGVCYHKKANKFFLTGATTTGCFTSVDGLTWTQLVVGVDLPQSVANTFPVPGGDAVIFVPRVAANTAATMGLIFDDGSMTYAVGNLIQSNTSARYGSTVTADGDRGVWLQGTSANFNIAGLDLINASATPTSIGSITNGGPTAGSAQFMALAGDRLITVVGAVVTVTSLLKSSIGTSVSATLPITPTNSCILVDGNTFSILSSGSLFVYQTVDFGVTWTAVPLSGVDRSAAYYGAAVFGGVPVVFTSLGLYVGQSTSGVKVIPQYASSTPGQKYVVKAK